MADFCLDCLKKQIKITKAKVSKDQSLCEGCGKIKNIVLKIKKA